ncbi:MAG: VIT1/CCC1 transporter family protein [Chlamydiota bacterium]|nr:VIT1/CCC1 transporter family protein [Chlamydiota bacterium]
MGHNHSHFNSKDAVAHVVEKQAQGIFDATEIHGTEIPGHWSAATDAAKETSIVILTVWELLVELDIPDFQIFKVLGVFAAAWLVWKSGRSAWLGWSRLERLHRIIAQEKWEIDHHRGQEREELKALYQAKGFEGKLLEDVVDTLMADGDRLLKVMVEEELGLSLESHEHPIKQSFGAAVGTIIATGICALGFVTYPTWGILYATLLVIGAAAGLSSRYESNRTIPAVVWNIGIAVLTYGTVHNLIKFFIK